MGNHSMPRRIRKNLKPDYAKFYQKCGKWEVIFRSVNWQKKIFGKQFGIIL